jgi:hypothetical protein
MTFTKLGDVLEWIQQIHRELSELCGHAARDSDERKALLAQSFRGWEETLSGLLKKLDEPLRGSVLETRVQFVPDEGLKESLAELKATRGSSPEALLDAAMEVQRSIITLVTQLRDGMQVPAAREALANLAAFEQSVERKLGRTRLTERDV